MRKLFGKFAVMVSLLAFMFGAIGPVTAGADSNNEALTDKVIFFAADGMRQDLIEAYADQRQFCIVKRQIFKCAIHDSLSVK